MRNQKLLSDERLYDLLLRPVVTEKSTEQGTFNKYTFVVPLDAAKPQVKQAVEKLFNVTVEAVHTIKLPGKVKRFRGRLGQRSDVKKAIITVKKDQTIDVSVSI